MLDRPVCTVIGICLAFALLPLLGSSVRPPLVYDGESLAAAVSPGTLPHSRQAKDAPTTVEKGEPTAQNNPAAEKKKADGILLDEGFNNQILDTAVWNTCHWWQDEGCTIASNDELEWYMPEQVTISGGSLHLTAEKRAISASNGTDYDFASGMVTTGPPSHDAAAKLAFTYGKVDVRFRIPAGQGLWPAIWLLPASEDSRPEIDMLEIIGDDAGRLRMRLHPKDRSAPSIGKKYTLPEGYTLAEEWHTIAVDWSPGKLVYFLDGRQVWQLVDEQVPDEPMYLVMNLAVGGSYPGPPSQDTEFPATFSIDHVRIHSHD